MYYNRYNSVVSYTTSVIPIFSQGTMDFFSFSCNVMVAGESQLVNS
jgi:hypothetical protein